SAYEELKFEFNGEVGGSTESVSPRNYEDTWTIRLGGEYMATDALAVRAGIYYDQTPVQDGYMTPETPDTDRIAITARIGYDVSVQFGIDLSFLYIRGMEREQIVSDAEKAGTLDMEEGTQDVLPGTYKLNAFVPCITLSFHF